MTKKEFIQEAVLRLLSPNCEIAVESLMVFVNKLADAVYGIDEEQEKEEEEVKPSSTSYEDEPISNVINEIDRIDEEDLEKRRKEAYEEGYRGYHPQKKGYAVRIESSFEELEIKTVGDLLSFGRSALNRARNLGKNSVDLVADALFNLYEIRF